MLYRVRIGQDDYLGTPEEVLAFMMRAQGAPPGGPTAYMEGIARRLAGELGVPGIATSGAEAFLLSLAERRVARVEPVGEPSQERHDPHAVLGEGPVTLGRGVSADDLPEAPQAEAPQV
ncbi:MAG: hypothetical protein ACKOSS_01795 [Planctomycetia bacterium]